MVSTQQYLCPDYLNPLSTSIIDSGKSPLELLAKTCNNIGLDPPAKAKLTLPAEPKLGSAETSTTKFSSSKSTSNGEKSTSKSGGHSSKSSAADRDAALQSPGETSSASTGSSKSAVHHAKESSSKKKSAAANSAAVDRDSNATAGDSANRSSSASANGGRSSIEAKAGSKKESASASESDRKSADLAPESSRPLSLQNETAKTPLAGQALPPTLPQPGTAPKCNGCLPTNYGLLQPHLPSSAAAGLGATTMLGLPSSGFPHSLSSFPPSSYPVSALQAAALASAGMHPFMSFCRDPNCRSCPNPAAALAANPPPLSLSSVGAGRPCPLGCTQCATGSHSAADLWWLSGAAGYPFFPNIGLSGLSPVAAGLPPVSIPSIPTSSALSALYAHAAAAQLSSASAVAAAASGGNGAPQHVCNWTVNNDYCGKRFSTAAELLEHLKIHTSQDSSAASSDAVKFPPFSSSSPQLLGMTSPGAGATYAGAAGRLSPRIASYMNSLMSMNRYHPYKSLMSPGSGSQPQVGVGVPHLPFPTLNPITGAASYPFSSLYSTQRLPGNHPHS